MKLEQTTAPVNNPVSDDLVEQQLRIGDGDDPLIVSNAIKFGTNQVEKDTGRALINQTWTMYLDKFPCNETIYVPKGKIQSITSFQYRNTSGVLTPLVDGTDYRIDDIGGIRRIEPIGSWPEVQSDRNNVVQLVWVAGYGADESSIPDWAKQAILLKCQQSYDGTDVMDAYESAIVTEMLFFDYQHYNI